MTKRKNRTYTDEFKQEAVALVTEQGYSVSKAAASLGIKDQLLYSWKAKFGAQKSGAVIDTTTHKGIYEARCRRLHAILQLRTATYI